MKDVHLANNMSVDLFKFSQQEGPDIQELEKFIQTSHDNLLSSGSLVPVFVFKKDEQLNIAMIAGEYMQNKPALAEALKEIIAKYNPSYYWFISEAWATTADAVQGADKLQEIAENQNIAELPRTKKEEVVMLSLTDCRNEKPQRWLGMYKIIRDRQGEIHNFSPTRWIKEDDIHTSKGNFVL